MATLFQEVGSWSRKLKGRSGVLAGIKCVREMMRQEKACFGEEIMRPEHSAGWYLM